MHHRLLIFISYLIRPVKRKIVNIITGTRNKRWEKVKNTNKSIKLKITPNISALFLPKGDIVRVLFTLQPFISYGRGGFERDEIEYFTNTLRKGDVIIDAGANIGLYSIIASKFIGEKGMVYAFEPALETFNTLKDNIALNRIINVKYYQMGLSDREWKLNLKIPKNCPVGYSDSYKFVDYGDNDIDIASNNSESEVINLTSIDLFCENNRILKIDFIKIDVEATQYQVLLGAKKTLVNNNVLVLFEAPPTVLVKTVVNYNQQDTFDLLKSIGYNIYVIECHTQKLKLVKSTEDYNHGNYIAKK